MGNRSNNETATKEVRKQARLQTDCSIKGTTMLAIQTMLRSGLKRDAFLPGLVSSEHWPGFIASYTIV